jgi:RHS repeat-associated protein
MKNNMKQGGPGPQVRHSAHRAIKLTILTVVAATHTLLPAAYAQGSTRPVVSYEYDAQGNLKKSTDALGRATQFNYDALNRLRQTTQPAPATGQPTPVIGTTFNPAGQLTAVTDPRSLVTSYTSSGLGDVTRQVSPDTGTTDHTYDAAGNLKTRKDARGRTTTYAYDALNRLTSATYGDATVTNFFYDEGTNGAGRLTRITDPGPISTSWTYDINGRVLTRTQTIGSGTGARTHTLTHTYAPGSGKRLTTAYPSGRILRLDYNSATRDLETLSFDAIVVAGQIGWHGGLVLSDAVKQMRLANGHTWTSTVDQDGRLTSYTLGRHQQAPATVSLTWDAANRITNITHGSDANLSQAFAYDGLDRLTAMASPPRDQGFTYDATGNRTSISERIGTNPSFTDTYNISATSNRLTGIANLSIGYGHDAAGNRTTTPTITTTYNARGRMSRAVVVNGATTQTFNYLVNGLEQRVRKTGPSSVVPSGTQIFVYDDEGHLLGEYDNLGRAKSEYIWLPGPQGTGPTYRPVAMVTYAYSGTNTTPTSQAIYAIEADHLGTPRRVSDSQNRTRWTWHPAPYGDTLPNENPSALGSFTLNLRFPGQYFDKETNTHYNHHRDYEATQGRYLQSDPIGLRGGINTYAYVAGRPTSYVDPLGLRLWTPPPWLMRPIPGALWDGWYNAVSSVDQALQIPSEWRGEPYDTRYCATGECAAGLLPTPKPWPTQCEMECGIGSDDWISRTAVCVPFSSVAGRATSVTGAGFILNRACSAIDKYRCVKECEERRNLPLSCPAPREPKPPPFPVTF